MGAPLNGFLGFQPILRSAAIETPVFIKGNGSALSSGISAIFTDVFIDTEGPLLGEPAD